MNLLNEHQYSVLVIMQYMMHVLFDHLHRFVGLDTLPTLSTYGNILYTYSRLFVV